jgi:pentatricopeptide repeat protein
LSFRKGETEQGISYFRKLFEKKRDHYDALSTLIRFLYRAGKIDEAKVFFDKIEKESPKALTDPGYNYAQGLFFQYVSNFILAIE